MLDFLSMIEELSKPLSEKAKWELCVSEKTNFPFSLGDSIESGHSMQSLLLSLSTN